MILGKRVSLIIPCKNEAHGLEKLIQRVPMCVDEIVVVDNNSTDATAQIAASLGARVLNETRKDKNGIGYGYALLTGMKNAKGEIIVTMDGDGTYPLHQIEAAVSYFMKNKLDFMSCSRFPLIKDQAISWIRKVGIWILNTEAHLLFGYPIQDVLSGMWVTNKRSLSKIMLTEGGWNLSPEIKIKSILNSSISFGEFHIDHDRREHELSKQRLWNTGFEHLVYIAVLWYQEQKARFTKSTYSTALKYLPATEASSS